MPRYFFHVFDGIDMPDKEGMELPDLRTARVEAIRLAGRLVDDDALRLSLGEDWRLEVADRYGLILFQINFLMTDAPAVLGGTETG